jgi:hypothetical protein
MIRTLTRTLTRLLIWILVVQTAFQPVMHAVSASSDLDRPFESEPLSSEARAMNRVADLIERADEKSLPSEKIKDIFHLVDQWVLQRQDDGSFREYHLMDLSQDPPTIVPPDFNRDVRVTLDSEKGHLNFEFVKNGEVVAIHQLRGLQPVLYAKDRELLIFLTKDNQAHAMDMAYARTDAFRSVLPVVDLTSVPVDLSQPENLKATFLKRGLKPVDTIETAANALVPLDVNSNETRYHAGDFILYRVREGGARVRELQLDRSTILTDLAAAEATLVGEVLALAPNEQLDELAGRLNSLLKSVQTKRSGGTGASSEESAGQDPWTRAFISRISPQSVETLVARAERNRSGSQEMRDQFTLREWLSHFQKILSYQQAKDTLKSGVPSSGLEGEELAHFKELQDEVMRTMGKAGEKELTPLSVFRSAMHSRGMRIVAAVTALGGGLGVAAYAMGLHHIPGFSALGAWIVFAANELYQNSIPEVLKDQKYRWTLLKSTVALSTLPVMIWFAGKMTAVARKLDWSGFKVIAAASFQVYAFTFLPVYNWIAKLSKQENFLKAMRLGINPLTEVHPDSALGKSFGLEQPVRPAIRSSSSSSSKAERNDSLLKAMLDQKNRVRALTWQLALMVISKRYRIDPGTLAVLMEKGPGFNSEQLEKIANDEAFRKSWEEVSEALLLSLSSKSEFSLTEDLSKVEPAELAKYYRIAEQTAQEMRKQDRLKAFALRMRVQWSQLSERLMMGIGNFGLRGYKDLRGWEPSQKDVVNPFVQQFMIDYYFTVFQMGVVGDRADLSRPAELAAEYYHPSVTNLWTNRAHLSDMVDQVRVYGLSLPASLALAFQRSVPVVEDSYHPIEDKNLRGEHKTQGFWSSLWDWTKGAGNLAEAQYGKTFKRDLIKRFKTIQAGIVMALFVQRMIFGGQGFVDASVAYIYTFAWAMWGYGWIWPILNRGNQVYRDRIDSADERFKNAKTLLGRGLRLENLEDFKAGFQTLAGLWEESSEELPGDLKTLVEKCLNTMNEVSPQELSTFQASNREFAAVVDEMRQGLLFGNVVMIEEGKNKLQTLLLRDQSLDSASRGAILKLGGADLLQYSMKHPPVATRANGAMELMSNVVGSFVSTYLYTSIAVVSFSKETNWSVVLPTTIGMSVALYLGVFQLQKAIDWLVEGDRIKRIGKRFAPASLAMSMFIGNAGADIFISPELTSKLADRAASLREVPIAQISSSDVPTKFMDPCEGIFSRSVF